MVCACYLLFKACYFLAILGYPIKSLYELDRSNPMDGVSNMSDAMLVLAVGIMLALVINWKVDLQIVGKNFSVENVDENKLDEVDIDKQTPVSNISFEDIESKYKKSGTVYTDVTTGKTYVVVEE